MIYIVEDDVSVRRSFEIFLESAGLDFRSFDSVETFLSSQKPVGHDLLLLDINLPGMSGLELLGELSNEGNPIPTIVITASDDAVTRESCMRYGVKAYLRKPVDETLIDLIRNHTSS